MTLLPSFSVVLALCILLTKTWKRCIALSRRRLLPRGCQQPLPPPWTGIYKAISEDSGRSPRVNLPSLQERNVLYVEKEIEEARLSGEADGYEVSHSQLALGPQVGKGAFGRVFLARAEAVGGNRGYMVVAVKKLKHKATMDEVEEFLAEIAMMKRVGRYPNIITMVGCCTLKQPLCMVMEYVPCGDLLAYLRNLRGHHTASTKTDYSYVTPNPPFNGTFSSSTSKQSSSVHSDVVNKPCLEYTLDPRELHSFAKQIAKGMGYLECMQITHRDLAARNILVAEDKTLKISDFGLSRNGIYVNTKRRKVPLRWLSIEAMRDSLYSSKSDVWAFGVVLWEIGTLGGFPYPTVSDYDLLQFLTSENRLDQPENISDELYSLMKDCWSQCTDDRPSFKDIVLQLDSSPRKSVYVDFRPDHQFPPTEQICPSTSTGGQTV